MNRAHPFRLLGAGLLLLTAWGGGVSAHPAGPSGPGPAQAGTTTTADQGTTQDGDVVDAEIIDEGDQDQQKGA